MLESLDSRADCNQTTHGRGRNPAKTILSAIGREEVAFDANPGQSKKKRDQSTIANPGAFR
jgi:hypothetical protein